MFSSALALLLAAQLPAGHPDSDIVVTGFIPDRQSVHRYVNDVSQTVGGQFARFRSPVCPEVLGMPADAAERIEGRIRDVAAHAGLAVASAHCSPNVSLFFAPDGAAFVRAVRRRYPGVVVGISASEHRRITSGDTPVRAWRITEAQNEDGIREGTRGVNRMPGRMYSLPYSTVRSSSYVNLATRQVVTHSVVVIDQGAALGKSLTQLADYTAMVALAGARSPVAAGGARPDTILDLFEAGRSPPSRLTRLDYQYLATLYASPADRRATHQLGNMSTRIVDALRADITN